jgi:hypothetical protein
MKWLYGHPNFEYMALENDVQSPWAGHKHFAYDLVSTIVPKVIVELGTHKGTSFFSMCQAAKDRNLKIKLYAVDTWQGDFHSGYYGADVFEKVSLQVKKYYSKLEVTLLKKNFDDAVSLFSDKSIDLLHIDGLHTYEAVKHDFEKWLPKVSPQGIILFHDIHTRQSDFGVHLFWDELKKRYPTLEFYHSYGLGILFLDPNTRNMFASFEKVWQRYYSLIDEHSKYVHETQNLSIQIKEKERNILDISKSMDALNQQKLLADGENKALSEQIIQQQQGFFEEHKIAKSELISFLDRIGQLDKIISGLESRAQEQLIFIKNKEKEIQDNVREIGDLKRQVSEKSSLISQKDSQIASMEASKFWKLRGMYLRIKWAVTHPLKFIKKYIWSSMPVYSQIKWATSNPKKFVIKYKAKIRNPFLSQKKKGEQSTAIKYSPERKFQEICLDLTPYLSKKFPLVNKKSDKKSVLVETRSLVHNEFIIKNTIQKLGDGWGHMIFCSRDNLKQIRSICADISPNIEIIVLDRKIKTRNDYNNMCLDIKFWNQITAEKIFIYQTDTFIFKDFDKSFLKWDYIGAPWPQEHAEYIKRHLNSGYDFAQGNGGLNVRNLNMTKKILKKYKPLKNIFDDKLDYAPEDLYFIHYAYIEGYKLADLQSSEKFAYEYVKKNNTFACHTPWLYPDFFAKQLFGINLLGFVNGVFGLAKNVRSINEGLFVKNIPHNLFELPSAHPSDFYLKPNNERYFPINLFCCNPDYELDKNLLKDKYNIAVWLWELEKLPESWKIFSNEFNEIWTASNFVKSTLEKELPGKTIKLIHIPIDLPKKLNTAEAKKHFNLNENDFVCLFIFDYYSDHFRKNPYAVVEAFKKAFPSNDKCKLVIKSHNGKNSELDMLNKVIGGDSRIRHISGAFSEGDMTTLLNASDVYMSLHRSEGFGLTLFEAILLEKPVICTNYSGNLDFCKPDWAGLVDCTMVEVPSDSLYRKMFSKPDEEIFWADASVEDAAKKLKDVHQHYDRYVKKTQSGRRWVLNNYSFEKTGQFISDQIMKIKINL